VSIRACAFAFADDANGRRLVAGIIRHLAGSAGRPASAAEGLQVVGENGPHRTYFDSIEPLPEQQPANVGLRCVELGCSLGDGEQARALDCEILARARNHFVVS
jgi:hypothetical protein